MAPTKATAQSAVLTGIDRYRRFRENFDREWNKPEVDADIGFLWAQTPDAIKAALRAQNPEAVKKVEKLYGTEVKHA